MLSIVEQPPQLPEIDISKQPEEIKEENQGIVQEQRGAVTDRFHQIKDTGKELAQLRQENEAYASKVQSLSKLINSLQMQSDLEKSTFENEKQELSQVIERMKTEFFVQSEQLADEKAKETFSDQKRVAKLSAIIEDLKNQLQEKHLTLDVLEYEALTNKYTIEKLRSQLIQLTEENFSLATEEGEKAIVEKHDVSTYTENSEYQNLLKRYD